MAVSTCHCSESSGPRQRTRTCSSRRRLPTRSGTSRIRIAAHGATSSISDPSRKSSRLDATLAMTNDLTLWGVGTSRTMRPHWMLLELGLEYEFHAIGSRNGANIQDGFLLV